MGKYTCDRCNKYTTDCRKLFWKHRNKTKKCGKISKEAEDDTIIDLQIENNELLEKILKLERENEKLKKGMKTCNNVIKMLKRRSY